MRTWQHYQTLTIINYYYSYFIVKMRLNLAIYHLIYIDTPLSTLTHILHLWCLSLVCLGLVIICLSKKLLSLLKSLWLMIY